MTWHLRVSTSHSGCLKLENQIKPHNDLWSNKTSFKGKEMKNLGFLILTLVPFPGGSTVMWMEKPALSSRPVSRSTLCFYWFKCSATNGYVILIHWVTQWFLRRAAFTWGTYNTESLSGWVCSRDPPDCLTRARIFSHVHISGQAGHQGRSCAIFFFT